MTLIPQWKSGKYSTIPIPFSILVFSVPGLSTVLNGSAKAQDWTITDGLCQSRYTTQSNLFMHREIVQHLNDTISNDTERTVYRGPFDRKILDVDLKRTAKVLQQKIVYA